MTYQMLTLICDYCTRKFDLEKIGFNAVGEVIMMGKCPDCGLANITETTFEQIKLNVQNFEISVAEHADISEIIITGTMQ